MSSDDKFDYTAPVTLAILAMIFAFAIGASHEGCGAADHPIVAICGKALVQGIADDLLDRVVADGDQTVVEASPGLVGYARSLGAKHGAAALRCALWEVVGHLRGRSEAPRAPRAPRAMYSPSGLPPPGVGSGAAAALMRAEHLLAAID